MHLLDVRTIVAITGVMACLMSLVLVVQRRSYPASIKGLDHWAAAPLVAFVSTVLFGLRGLLPDLLTLGVANVLLFLATGLQLSGSCRFFGVSLPRPFFPLLALLGLLALVWLSFFEGSYASRALFMCTLLGLMFLVHAAVIWRQPQQTFASRFTFAALSVLAIVTLARGVIAVASPTIEGLYSTAPSQVLYVVSLSFGLLLLPIGGVLMAAERLRQDLQLLVTQDSLTGALTRRALFELGESELARSQRHGTPLSVLMLDLDHFKQINDRHGHRVGDLVIRDFVEHAHSMLRRPSILGRYGGEEFVAVLPDTDAEQALQVAERIRAACPTDPQLPRWHVSIGVATVQPPQQQTLEALIDRADAALYRAKELGRNRVEILQG